MALRKSEIKAPVLPKEAVQVNELGGEVIVRGLLLRERLAIFNGADTGVNFAHIGQLLAATVVDADGLPIYTADEWDQFGNRHFSAALSLFQVARRLSGIDAELAQKN
jgi:hypothetical protein